MNDADRPAREQKIRDWYMSGFGVGEGPHSAIPFLLDQLAAERQALRALEGRLDMDLLCAQQDAKVNGFDLINPYVLMFTEALSCVRALLPGAGEKP